MRSVRIMYMRTDMYTIFGNARAGAFILYILYVVDIRETLVYCVCQRLCSMFPIPFTFFFVRVSSYLFFSIYSYYCS